MTDVLSFADDAMVETARVSFGPEIRAADLLPCICLKNNNK
jgi:hypothetical protein